MGGEWDVRQEAAEDIYYLFKNALGRPTAPKEDSRCQSSLPWVTVAIESETHCGVCSTKSSEHKEPKEGRHLPKTLYLLPFT